MRVARLVSPWLLVALAAAVAPAQVITGTVRDSATRAGVLGAVVTLDDSAGHVLSRTLTDDQGAYRLVWSADARRLRVVRIGFRPSVVPLGGVPGGGAPRGAVDVTMQGLATLLEPMQSIAQQSCPKRDDGERAYALWEQAKLALLASVVARETSPLTIERLRFYRVLGEDRPSVLTQIVRLDTVTSGQPFASGAPPEMLVRDGFRTTIDDRPLFYAPDADVLLDDAFVGGYCLQLARPHPVQPTWVGLLFEPAQPVTGRIDIDGIVWVDTVTRALTDIEFRYRGFERREEVELMPGGEIGFETMPDGIAMVTRWAIRVPAKRGDRTESSTIAGSRAERRTLELHEMGGEVAVARMPNGSAWREPLGQVRGVVSLEGAPLPFAYVKLAGTSYLTQADSNGAFVIDGVLPGRYVLALGDPAFEEAAFEFTVGQSVVVGRYSPTEVVVKAPTTERFVRSMCESPDPFRTTFLVRVVTHDGRPAPRARVNIMYGTSSMVGAWALPTSTFFLAVHGKVGAAGTVIACDVPRVREYRVTAALDGRAGSVTITPEWGSERTVFPVLVRLPAPDR